MLARGRWGYRWLMKDWRGRGGADWIPTRIRREWNVGRGEDEGESWRCWGSGRRGDDSVGIAGGKAVCAKVKRIHHRIGKEKVAG